MSEPARRLVASIDAGGEALVHSVFRSAINVVTGGSLLTLASEKAGGLPNGILVSEETPLPDLRHLDIRPGARVVVHDGSLHCPSAVALTLDLRSATTWSARLARRDGTPWPSRSARAWDLGARASIPGGIASLPMAEARVAALRATVRSADRAGAARAARPLLGLGPGLTPSGDDLLIGLEAALRTLGHPAAGFLARALGDVDDRTTVVSATLLRHAARGEFTERIGTVLALLLGEAEDAVPEAIARCIAWGATSGSDTLRGILEGLDGATGTWAAAA